MSVRMAKYLFEYRSEGTSVTQLYCTVCCGGGNG